MAFQIPKKRHLLTLTQQAVVVHVNQRKIVQNESSRFIGTGMAQISFRKLIEMNIIYVDPETKQLHPTSKGKSWLLGGAKEDEVNLTYHGEHMPMEDWADSVREGIIKPGEGFAVYASATGIKKATRDIRFFPCDLLAGKVDEEQTHVMWYKP